MTDRSAIPPSATVTVLGGPTALIRLAGWTLLTDPTFDPAGTTYADGPVQVRKLEGPAIAWEDLPPVHLALVSHTQHVDNLDHTGRLVLNKISHAVTTPAGAGDLGPASIGLAPWEDYRNELPGRTALTVTAVPAQHGPDGTEAVTGPVTGFLVEADDEKSPTIYVSGDTVDIESMRELARRHRVDVALLHLGAAGFTAFGDARLSMTADMAVAAWRVLGSPIVVAIHAEGWAHYTQGRGEFEAAFIAAGADLIWPRPGEEVPLEGLGAPAVEKRRG